MKNNFKEVGRLLRNSKRVLFITGAGVSAESQIPTFRGATAAFADGMTEDGVPFEEVLSGTTFIRNPKLSWKYLFRLELSARGKKPNAAHFAMAALQTPSRHVCVATQNIDGLHQRAGSKTVLELHGNLRRVICTQCEYLAHLETFESMPPLPLCPECNGLLRPDVVLYEESLPEIVFDVFEQEQRKGFDVVFSVGTTSLFHYVTQPIWIATQRGTPVVEINPEETPISELADFRFPAPAGPTMQQLMKGIAPFGSGGLR
jgi:NAD-dependent deacetylase